MANMIFLDKFACLSIICLWNFITHSFDFRLLTGFFWQIVWERLIYLGYLEIFNRIQVQCLILVKVSQFVIATAMDAAYAAF